MSRKAKPRGIPFLAQHHAQPPVRMPADWEGAKAVAARLNQSWGPNLIDAAEAKMIGILQQAGMPTDPMYVFNRPNGGWSRGLAREVVRRGHQLGSDVWYAAKILEDIAAVRRAQGEGKPDQLLHDSLHLGGLLMEANIVIPYGREFDTGLKVHVARAQTRQAENAKRKASAATKHRLWIAEARKVWEAHPQKSTADCARVVIKRLGLSQSHRTVRGAIAGAKPQKVGKAG